MSTQTNAALALDLYERFDEGDLDGFADSVGSDFVAHVLGTTVLDWNGFKQFGASFRAAFPDGHHVFDHVLTDGDRVITIGTYQGTHAGALQGIAPTHRRLELVVMHADRVIDGRIVEHLGLGNELDLMRQLGIALVPDPKQSGRARSARHILGGPPPTCRSGYRASRRDRSRRTR